MNATLEAAGISLKTQTYTQPSAIDLTAVFALTRAEARAVPASSGDFITLGHGWDVHALDLSGKFGIHYDVRAHMALTGYLQLQAS